MKNLFWLIDMIMPITMLLLGLYYRKKANKSISIYSGLCTKVTIQSQENWKLSHYMASKILINAGLILSIYTIIIKTLAPLSVEWLSLINICINLTVYIGTTIYVNYKVSHNNKRID